MNIEAIISGLIIVFVLSGALYDVELNPINLKNHRRVFRWKRLLNWFPMGIAYAAFYMARYNVAAGNVESVRRGLNYTEKDMGWVISIGSWTYAFTAPFTGQITDRIGGRNGMMIACLGSSVCNVLLALNFFYVESLTSAVSKVLFCLLYALNILFQGFGTSAVVKINAQWYLANERGVFSGVFNIMLSSGYFLALGSGSSIIQSLGWPFVFLIPGLMLFFMAVILNIFLKNTPALEDRAIELQNITVKDHSGHLPANYHVRKSFTSDLSELIQNPTFVSYLFGIFFMCWARDGFLNWMFSFFETQTSAQLATVSTSDAAAIIGGAWTIGGFIGGVLCGWISDSIFKSRRVPPLLWFTGLQFVSLGSMYIVSTSYPGGIGSVGGIMLIGFLVFLSSICLLGNYTLLSYTVPSDLPYHIAATAAGLMTAVGYFATGLSGIVMGALIQSSGYSMWIISLLVSTLLTGLFIGGGWWLSCRNTTDHIVAESPIFLPKSRSFVDTDGKNSSIVTLNSDFVASPSLNIRPTTNKRTMYSTTECTENRGSL